MIPEREPLCLYCRRFLPDTSCPPRCGAFPDGIPSEIFMGVLSHTTPLRDEPTFLGSIPVGWETRAPEDEYDEKEPTMTPARRIEDVEVRVVRD